MWMDIAVAAVFVFSTARGYRIGFARSFLHATGWILSIVLGFVWFPKVEAFLRDNTDYYESIREAVQNRLDERASEAVDPFADRLPALFRDGIASAEEAVTTALSEGFADFLMSVISFLLVMLAIRLLFLLLASLLGKKHQGGVIGFVDGVLGLAAGALKGILLVFFLLALLVPVLSLSGGDFLADSLANAKIAGPLYDNNLILLIVKDAL